MTLNLQFWHGELVPGFQMYSFKKNSMFLKKSLLVFYNISILKLKYAFFYL